MITITGATGRLGRLTVEALLERGVPADRIVAAVRTPDKAADLAERGVQVRRADYDEPKTLAAALAGTTRLLLVSGSEVGRRVPQHRNVVEAAAAANVELIAYTGILNCDTSKMVLAEEHKATEAVIRESGLPHVFLRNGWYLENYTENLAPALESGTLIGAAGDGRIAAATRADYAAAAAAVLTGDGHAGKTYELGGDTPFTMAELAAELSRQTGRDIAYRNMSEEEYAKALVAAGVPEPYAKTLADSDTGIARGDLTTGSGHLRALIGRPTTALADAVAAALKG
ncbi:NAD(P)-dependent oxidoreductase [Actinomadura sp. NBRC 104425]|uniref:SDR family oxidoreductase n=1 Tax=Actinomadura sp. NBRC 104425 TaxID=3032204 RepID=UPI0024A2853D|nr:SDR family oxidoreductase [Actinomadura sp. NBRC 104425]GLZ11468.1 NAD(P)-dependent oxidoreductase [Actinomadura sp. NBRC 104425]